MQVERPGDRPITNVMVDGRLWGAVSDEMLFQNVGREPGRIADWAENVVRSLLTYLRDGKDIWGPELEAAKFDFLMRCAT